MENAVALACATLPSYVGSCSDGTVLAVVVYPVAVVPMPIWLWTAGSG